MKISLGRGADIARSKTPRAVLLICVVLALVTFGVFDGVVHYDYVNYDDYDYIKDNPQVKNGLTPSDIVWAFTTGHASNWHPLTWLSHMLDCQIYGPANPGGYHLTNLIFHVANALLLFLLLRRMTGAVWRSAVVAALFAWHPLHVESVAWISERKDVLSTLFWLLTMFAYLRYVKEVDAGGPKSRRYYRWMLVLFALGLMSKPMLVTLPFVLLLLDFWPLGRFSKAPTQSPDAAESTDVRKFPWQKLVMEKLPMIGMAVISSAITILVQHKGGAVMPTEIMPVKVRFGNALLAYIGYLRKTIWPTNLAIFYPLHISIFVAHVVAAGLLLAAISAAAVKLARSRPYVLFGWLWFLGTLVPVIGLVQVGAQSMADRYSYMPLVGLFIVFTWGVADLIGKGHLDVPNPAWAILGPVLAACLVLTWNQLPHWKNGITLFQHDIEATTDNFVARRNLASAYDDANRPADAEVEFAAALKLMPDDAATLNAFGLHIAKRGDYIRAASYYIAALRNQPSYSDAHYNLGNVLARQGKFADAAEQYSQAVRLKPGEADAHNNYGAMLMRLDRLPEAVDQFKEALRLDPNFPEVQDELAGVYARLGHLDLAQIHYAEAVLLKPDFVHARLRLGLVLAQQGYFQQAIPQFDEVIKSDPQNPEAYFDLAAAYMSLNRLDDAIKTFNEVIRVKPDDTQARVRLAQIYTTQGKTQEAIQTYREVLRIRSDSPDSMRGLAWILATTPKAELRNGAEAVSLAEKANTMTGGAQPLYLSALDAAYGEAGRFDDAIKTAQQAQQIATAKNQSNLAQEAGKRLESYRAGKPFHE